MSRIAEDWALGYEDNDLLVSILDVVISSPPPHHASVPTEYVEVVGVLPITSHLFTALSTCGAALTTGSGFWFTKCPTQPEPRYARTLRTSDSQAEHEQQIRTRHDSHHAKVIFSRSEANGVVFLLCSAMTR